MEPGGVKLAGMPPRAAEDGGSELARTTSVVFFIKLELWRMEAWRLARMPPPCHGGWTELVRTTPIVFFIKQAPLRMEARSSEDAAASRGHSAKINHRFIACCIVRFD